VLNPKEEHKLRQLEAKVSWLKPPLCRQHKTVWDCVFHAQGPATRWDTTTTHSAFNNTNFAKFVVGNTHTVSFQETRPNCIGQEGTAKFMI